MAAWLQRLCKVDRSKVDRCSIAYEHDTIDWNSNSKQIAASALQIEAKYATNTMTDNAVSV